MVSELKVDVEEADLGRVEGRRSLALANLSASAAEAMRCWVRLPNGWCSAKQALACNFDVTFGTMDYTDSVVLSFAECGGICSLDLSSEEQEKGKSVVNLFWYGAGGGK
jgi:hypothetical protein